MYINLEEMNAINNLQYKIFESFVNVCEILNIDYFMVHGSLLGAIKFNDFFPYDDDIDVAMMRKDYEKLISEGPKYFPKDLFLQSCESEDEFPLPFAKIRDSNTAFIQPILDNCHVNKGIYIDIFPIDFFPENKMLCNILKIKNKLYSMRISKKLYSGKKISFLKKVLLSMSIIFCPSYKKAVRKRAYLYKKIKKTNKLIMVGGKKNENNFPIEWFSNSIEIKFRDIMSKCPKNYDNYLRFIYGDYINYNPSEKYMKDDKVKVSAEYISLDKSYREL